MNQFDIARRWREALAGEEHVPYEQLERFVDARLDDEQRLDVEAHLELCAICVGETDDLREFADSLRVRTFRRRRTILYSAAGLAAAAMLVIVVGIDRLRSQVTPAPHAQPVQQAQSLRSMAVLPLRNATNNSNDAFLSVAIADALVTRLEHRRDVAVRPMASVLPVRSQNADVRTVARKLDVDGVLEGHYDATAEHVRVTMQLTDSRTGRAVWHESVDGPRGDLLKLVDDVTARTESRLNGHTRVALDRTQRSEPRSTNPKAYESYLVARSLYGSFRPGDYAAHIAALEKAIELDPSFAAAHADLALALTIGVVRSLATEPDVIDRAEWHAYEAVRLDPNLSEAHLSLGRVLARRSNRFREGVREIVAALRLKPTNTSALQAMVSYFAYDGDVEKMRCVGQRIIRIDPLSDEAKTRGYWFNKTLEGDLAIRAAEHALNDPASELAGHDIRGEAFIYQGNISAAEREAAAALKLDPERYHGQSLMAMIAAARGNRAEAALWLAKFDAEARRNHFAAVRTALCHAKLGDTQAALDWIDRAIFLGNHGWYLFTNHSWLAPLRGEPRFQSSVARVKADLDAVHDDVIEIYPLIADESCAGNSGIRALSGVRAAP